MAKQHRALTHEYTTLNRVFREFMAEWRSYPGLIADEPINVTLVTDSKRTMAVPQEAMLSESEFLSWASDEKLRQVDRYRMATTESGGARGVMYLIFGETHGFFGANRDSERDERTGQFIEPEPEQPEPGYYDEFTDFPTGIEPEEKPVKPRKPKTPPAERPYKDARGNWRWKGKFIKWTKARAINAAITRKRRKETQ